MKIMNKTKIESLLREEYANSVVNKQGRRSPITLPDSLELKMSSKGTIHFHFSVASVLKNMQTDDAAFEAWSLILKRWITKVDTIVLKWEEPRLHFLTPAPKQHYQRFLFRVKRFNQLFSWFRIDVANKGSFSQFEVLDGHPYVINAPTKPRTRLKEPIKKISQYGERALETQLVSNDMLRGKLESLLNLSVLNNQLPVCVFKEKKSKPTRIFTGSASAIDIWGLTKDRGTMVVLELKKHGAIMVGIITELLFYSLVMNEVRKGKFKYEEKKSGDFKMIADCKNIHGYTLASRLHPLLDERVFRLINQAMRSSSEPMRFGIIRMNENWTFTKEL